MEPEEFDLPCGETVKLRGLTGFEVMLSRKKYPDDEIGMNTFVLSVGMGISEGAALEWLRTHLAGDFVAVENRLQELSGMKPDAQKEAYKSLRSESGPGVSVLPSGEAGHDGSPDAPGDQ